MNVAIMLMSAAWLSGGSPQVPQPATPQAPAAPVIAHTAPAPVAACPGGNCGGTVSHGCATCDNGCGEKPGLFARFRGLFAKNDCCEPACAPAPKPECKPVHVPSCACDPCEKPSLFNRLFGRFKKSEECGCDTCGSGTVVVAPGHDPVKVAPAHPSMPSAEPIKKAPAEVPNKLPVGSNDKGPGIIPSAPELTPASAKTIELENKQPF